jgi:CDP-diacylglycerol--glycerol-3-phosphate 3-phosphatidyltransferase
VVWLVAWGEPAAALGVFLLAAATDLVDGPLARRRGQVTARGAFLDPLADKVLIAGTLTALALHGAAPVWAVAVILGRELVAVEVRARSRDGLAATADGKAKTVLQTAAVATLLAAQAWPSAGLGPAAAVLLAAAVALTVLSGVMLVRRAT